MKIIAFCKDSHIIGCVTHVICPLGLLKQHLLDINRDAQEEFEIIVRQTAKAEGVTEELKKRDQMEWVRRMNSIRDRADEFIRHDLIYT